MEPDTRIIQRVLVIRRLAQKLIRLEAGLIVFQICSKEAAYKYSKPGGTSTYKFQSIVEWNVLS
jgi:hypothetical protein